MKRGHRFLLLLGPPAVLASACGSFTGSERTSTDTPALTEPVPGMAPTVPVPGTADAGTPGSTGDAGAGPSACVPGTLTDTFPDSTLSAAWSAPQLANGGSIGFAAQTESPPLSLRATGPFPPTGAGRARIQRALTFADGARSADVTYALSFGSLPMGVTFDLGCTLELSRADGTTARARLSDSSVGGSPLSGLLASVDATGYGTTDATVAAPEPQVLSNEISTLVWYTVHVGATFDSTSAQFTFDLESNLVNGHVGPIAIPFGGVTGALVSCGVDNAVMPSSSAGTSYEMLLDDVSVSACTR